MANAVGNAVEIYMLNSIMSRYSTRVNRIEAHIKMVLTRVAIPVTALIFCTYAAYLLGAGSTAVYVLSVGSILALVVPGILIADLWICRRTRRGLQIAARALVRAEEFTNEMQEKFLQATGRTLVEAVQDQLRLHNKSVGLLLASLENKYGI